MSNSIFHPSTPNTALSTLDARIEELSRTNVVSSDHLVRIQNLRSVLADIEISVSNRNLLLHLMGFPTNELVQQGWHAYSRPAMDMRSRNTQFYTLISQLEQVGTLLYPPENLDYQLPAWEKRVEHMRRQNLNLSEQVHEAENWTDEECVKYGVREGCWDGWNGEFLVEKKGVFKDNWNFGDAWGKGAGADEVPVSPKDVPDVEMGSQKGGWDVDMEEEEEEEEEDDGHWMSNRG